MYIISGVILAVAMAGMFYHASWLALEIAFEVNAIVNNEIAVVSCLALGFVSALIFNKCED
jgi:hypothetical protein